MPQPQRSLLALGSLLALTTLAAPHAQAQSTYTFTDLGAITIPTSTGGDRTAAFASSINNAGQISATVLNTDGKRRTVRITPTVVNGQTLWYRDSNNDGKNDLMQLLGLPQGYNYSVAGYNMSYSGSINSAGQVVGTIRAQFSTDPQRATLWSGNSVGAILGKKTDAAFGMGINDAADIIVLNATSVSGIFWRNNNGAYVATTIAAPTGFSYCEPRAVNNLRQVTGRLAPAFTDSFVWSPTQPAVVLGRITGHVGCTAWAINDAGVITGSSSVPRPDGGVNSSVFLRTPGATDGDPNNPQMKDLGTLYDSSVAYGVNNASPPQIVGDARSDSGGFSHAFVWQNGAFLDLHNATVNLPAGCTLYTARGINDLGQIVANYTYIPAGQTRAVTRACLLTPNP